ncbi:MAG: hypothetical protein NVSMB55_14990 [Mycobacteriales bacterium]
MVVLGLLLLLAAGLVTAGMVLQNTDASSASLFGQAVTGTVGGLFVAGAITGAIAILGVIMMVAGLTRRRARRAGLRRQVRDARGERKSLAEENARLKNELQARGSATYPADGAVADGNLADGNLTDDNLTDDNLARESTRGKHGLFHQ